MRYQLFDQTMWQWNVQRQNQWFLPLPTCPTLNTHHRTGWTWMIHRNTSEQVACLCNFPVLVFNLGYRSSKFDYCHCNLFHRRTSNFSKFLCCLLKLVHYPEMPLHNDQSFSITIESSPAFLRFGKLARLSRWKLFASRESVNSHAYSRRNNF